MKIIFLCGSLEPGRDGVGDYVRQLAIELQRQGHQTWGIALNDPYITQDLLTTQESSSGNLSVLRLPAAWAASKRFARAQQLVTIHNPDWLSLQFVPFSFHPKGLPFSLIESLARLSQGRAWHLMVHELWVGMETKAPIKYVWWGRLQRYLIKVLIKRLKPRIIHTQIPLYQAQLRNLGFLSYHLPLFSNITNEKLSANTNNLRSEEPDCRANHFLSFVVFGTIHPGAPIAEFAREAAEYAQRHATSIQLTMIGRCGSEQVLWADSWRATGLPVEILGEQPPNRISEVLVHAALGISTTPAYLLGKSGTAAAMREHGLPILCVSPPWHPKGLTEVAIPAGTALYEAGKFDTYLTKPVVQPPVSKVADIAYQMAKLLLLT